MRRWLWWFGGLLLALVLAVITALAVLARRTDDGVRDVPFSRASSRGRVGADWAERAGYAGPAVAGEVEDFETVGRAGFDAAAVDSEVRRFYEETEAYALAYVVEWHRGFRLGARLASVATGWLEQLNLPGRSHDGVHHLESRLERVPAVRDGRDSVVWTRTNRESGVAVFVAVYATDERRGVTYANVAVPLPFGNLSTVLRPVALEGDGVAFTTAGPGDGGLYLVTPLGPLALPMAQTFRVWPAGVDGTPAAPTPDADLVATHEMWLCGRQFLTIRYGISRSDDGEASG